MESHKKSIESSLDSTNRVPQDSFALYRKIANYAIICIAFLICVFNPYALYATDITQFDSTQTLPTLGALFGVFLTTSFIAIYAVSFIPKKFAKISAFAFSLALFIGLVYSFILVGDYGAMDHFILQKPPFSFAEITRANARELILVLTLGIVVVLVAFKWLIYAWRVVLATMIIISGINATNIALQRIDSHKSTAILNSKSPPPIAFKRTLRK